MDLLDRVGKKGGNKNSSDRMGLFQPQRRKAETLLLAWLSASLRSSRSQRNASGRDFGILVTSFDYGVRKIVLGLIRQSGIKLPKLIGKSIVGGAKPSIPNTRPLSPRIPKNGSRCQELGLFQK